MSSYYKINYDNPKDNFAKKEKFFNINSRLTDNQIPNKMDSIDTENKLKKMEYNTKSKIQVSLNDNLNPNNYDIKVKNIIKPNNDNNSNYHFIGNNFEPGRGFGNLNVSNDIRYGFNSRCDSKVVKQEREQEVIERWDFIDNRYQNVNNIVMEMPRGGESTRKEQNQLVLNNLEQDKEIKYEIKY